MEEKKVSKVCMSLCQSTGTWLNGCLQKQHHYVHLELTDPEGSILAKVALSFEQAARMLLYNGDVECTLERYRNKEGRLVVEEVAPPETVHARMKDRLSSSHDSLIKRLEDLKKDVYEIVNGDKTASKGTMKNLLQNIGVVLDHVESNEPFVVQQAEEELQKMQSSTIGQIGTYLQAKFGLEVPEEALKHLIPISNEPLMIGEPVSPVEDDYEVKERKVKTIDEMTASDVAIVLSNKLREFETKKQSKVKEGEYAELFYASASASSLDCVKVTYINYQGSCNLTLQEAKGYLLFLCSITKEDDFEKHYRYKGKK